MNELRCETVQERLPDLVGQRLSEGDALLLRAHLDACADCREEAALISTLLAGRPTAPEGLAQRIEGSVRFRGRAVTRPWWGLAAAAVAAVALGIGVTSSTTEGPPEVVPAFVAEAGEQSVWLSDDGFIAGAATLGDLSEEALMTLLDEMGAGPTGGAA